MKEINIPDGLKKIPGEVFRGCESLREINIPNSVTKIDDRAFYGCYSLQEIRIPDSVTKIGSCAFDGCESLQEITIPDGVTEIGIEAFYGCESLKFINYNGHNIKSFIDKHDSSSFGIIKSLNDNDLPLTDDMYGKAIEAKKNNRLRGFIVKTKKRLSERETPDVDYSDSDDKQFEDV